MPEPHAETDDDEWQERTEGEMPPPERVTFRVLLRAMRRIEDRVDQLADAQRGGNKVQAAQTKAIDSLAVAVEHLAAEFRKAAKNRDPGRDR